MLIAAAVPVALAAWGASALVDRRPGAPPAHQGRWWSHALVGALAALFAAAAARVLQGPLSWVPFAYLAVAGVAMARIDLHELRLPDRLVLPAYPLTAVCFAAAAAVEGQWMALARAAGGAVLLWGMYRLLRALRPGELGRGDVKLAGVLGAQLAWLGWGAWWAGAMLGFVLFAVVGIITLRSQRTSWRARRAFGPYMLAGELAVVSGLALVF